MIPLPYGKIALAGGFLLAGLFLGWRVIEAGKWLVRYGEEAGVAKTALAQAQAVDKVRKEAEARAAASEERERQRAVESAAKLAQAGIALRQALQKARSNGGKCLDDPNAWNPDADRAFLDSLRVDVPGAHNGSNRSAEENPGALSVRLRDPAGDNARYAYRE